MSSIWSDNPDVRDLEKLHYETLLTPKQKRTFRLKNVPKTPMPPTIYSDSESWFLKYFVAIFMIATLSLGLGAFLLCIYL